MEICHEAAIGRKTFYRNFDTKEDVVEFRRDILCARYKERIMGMTLAEQLRHHMEFAESIDDVVAIVHRAHKRQVPMPDHPG